jgi:predicted secreted protein
MAEVAGKGGSVTFTGLTAGVKSWSLDLAGDTLETTDYDDSGHRTYIAGLDGWTANCELNWDTANTVSIGDSATLTLTIVSSTEAYSGTALVNGISVSSSVEGVVTATISFQGTGVCTLTSA